MKCIEINELKNYRGGALLVPRFNEMGEVITAPIVGPKGETILDKAGEPLTRPVTGSGTILDILDYALLDFPRNKLTMKHITEATRLMGQIAKCRENNLTELQLEDAQYEWLVSILKNDQIGVPMFGLNLVSVLNALGADIA